MEAQKFFATLLVPESSIIGVGNTTRRHGEVVTDTNQNLVPHVWLKAIQHCQATTFVICNRLNFLALFEGCVKSASE